MSPDDPLGFGSFNSQALHPDEQTMNSGGLPSRPQHAFNQSPSGLEGLLARNAPVIGGTIGAIAAAPLNLLDAVSGVGGTALDVGAAGVGTDIGQRIKNALDPNQATNPEKEGAIGAASELGGLGIGKALSKGTSVLKNAAPDLFKEAFNIPTRLISRLKPTKTAQQLVDYGISGSLKKMFDISNNAMDVLDNIYRGAIGTVKGNVDITPAIEAAKRVIDSPLTNNLQPADERKILDTISNAGIEGPAPNLSDPQNVVDHMRNIQSVGHSLVAAGSSKTNPDRRLIEQGQAYLAAGDKMQNILDDIAGSKSVKTFQTPENEAALKEISPKLAQEFMQAKTPQEVRTLMAPFYNLKQMAKITMDNPKSSGYLARAIGGVGGFGVGGLPGAVAGMLGSPIIEGIENRIRPSLSTTVARGINTLAGGAQKLAANTGKKIAGNLTRRDVVNKALTQTFGQGFGNLFGQKADPSTGLSGVGPVSNQVSSQINNIITTAQQHVNQNPQIPLITPEQEQQILATSGTEGLDALMRTQQINLETQAQEEPKITQNQQDDINNIAKNLQAISLFSQAYDKIYATGAGAGTVSELMSHIPGLQNTGGAAALTTYEKNKSDLAASLADVLGSGRSSAAMINQLKSELPDATTSPLAAQQMFSTIIQRLQGAMNLSLALPATNVPGQLSNFAGQSIPGLQTSLNNNIGEDNFLNYVSSQTQPNQ